jgi:hypothetical protein
LSVEKGLRGNIGKIAVAEKKDGKTFMDVMLFLVPNGDNNEDTQSQVVNAHFPEEAFDELKNYDVSDYVRVYFDRIDLAKGINKQSGKEALYISVKASGIEMLKKADKKVKKEKTKLELQQEKKPWGKKS